MVYKVSRQCCSPCACSFAKKNKWLQITIALHVTSQEFDNCRRRTQSTAPRPQQPKARRKAVGPQAEFVLTLLTSREQNVLVKVWAVPRYFVSLTQGCSRHSVSSKWQQCNETLKPRCQLQLSQHVRTPLTTYTYSKDAVVQWHQSTLPLN